MIVLIQICKVNLQRLPNKKCFWFISENCFVVI